MGLVAYSPLGRGFLSGSIRSLADLGQDDFRRLSPRFAEAAFAANLRLVDEVKAIAATKGCTASQLALAWVAAQGEDIVSIPGTKRRSYLEQNVAAAAVEVTEADLTRLAESVPVDAVSGDRYPDMSTVET